MQGGCTKTCGGGVQKWSRYKLQEARYGGKPCSGVVVDKRSCNNGECPAPIPTPTDGKDICEILHSPLQ